MNMPVVIAAGGTGGHFFPAEALATCLKQRGHDLVLMTDQRNTHRTEGVFADCPQFVLPGSGIAGKGLYGKFRGGSALIYGVMQARKLLGPLRPAVLVGFGGYPSIPPLLGARLLPKTRRPALIIHEGNAILGKANGFIAPFATAIATSYEQVAHIPPHIPPCLTGMPVRPGIEALAHTPYHPVEADGDSPINLLIWGGSLGASVFARIVPQALAALPETLRKRLHIIQQVHDQDIEQVRACYESACITAVLKNFLHDIPDCLKKAHLVIGRAGGSSIAELTMSARPSVLVPLPIAASDEQGHNAQALSRKGAAWMIRQPDFTQPALTALLEDLFTHPEKLTEAAEAARALQHSHSAEKLADLVERIMKTPPPS